MLILSNIFTSAWQLSAMEGRARAERERFFSNVYSVYEALAMVGAAVLMAASRLIMRFLAAPDYFSAWHYAPVLTPGTAFGCLGAFFATVYMVEKRSAATLTTTAAGAAIVTLASYIVIFAARHSLAHAAEGQLQRAEVPRRHGRAGLRVLPSRGRAHGGVRALLRVGRAALRQAAHQGGSQRLSRDSPPPSPLNTLTPPRCRCTADGLCRKILYSV